MGLMTGLILATIFPLLFLGIIRKADFYQVGRYHLVLVSLGCGAIAYLFAALTNLTLQISMMIDHETINHIIAPALEEVLKGLALLGLIRTSRITFSVDGALYGFATGVGFAVLENYEFINADPTVAIAVALQRIFSANLVHATGSAIIGMAMGAFYVRRSRWRGLVLASGISLAIGLHIFYNILSQGSSSFVGAFGIGIAGFIFIYLVVQRGKKQAQDWIRKTLGKQDRITRAEAAVVNRLPTMDNLLLPVVKRFGPQTAGKVEKLLYLEARLGIKCKTFESFQADETRFNTVEAEIDEMRTQIDAARRDIGTYAMLFVRGMYAEEVVSVWEQLQAKTKERSMLTGGQKSGGLWSTLEERIKVPSDAKKME